MKRILAVMSSGQLDPESGLTVLRMYALATQVEQETTALDGPNLVFRSMGHLARVTGRYLPESNYRVCYHMVLGLRRGWFKIWNARRPKYQPLLSPTHLLLLLHLRLRLHCKRRCSRKGRRRDWGW